jgi:hypothetical protein
MNWDEFRREDGSIDLIKAFENQPQQYGRLYEAFAMQFLARVESRQRIHSRQAAAIAIAAAEAYGEMKQ